LFNSWNQIQKKKCFILSFIFIIIIL
jgi:hypothetical protein